MAGGTTKSKRPFRTLDETTARARPPARVRPVLVRICVTICSRAARVRTHHTQATMIFRAKANRVKRGSLSAELVAEFGITSKAVRDIWKLRTWTWKTLPCWTQADHDDFLPKHLCQECMVEHKAGNVRVLSDACELCANPPPLGRPAIDRTVPFGTEASAGAWAGTATDPAHPFQSGFSELADGGPMFGGTVMETEASAGAWAGAATDPAHPFKSGFSDLLAVGGPADPMFEANPSSSFSDFFSVPSPQELLDSKGISGSEA